MDRASIVARDKRFVWHPYTSIDDYERIDPIVVASAKGSTLVDADGRTYLDGNSSWWVATLGHGHPRLLRALREQSERLAHCALAGIAHEPAAALAEELVAIAPKGPATDDALTRVFYTDNGSGSIEVAVKVALQTWQQRGAPKKTRFVALDGAFHGDTLAPTSLGGVDVFRRPFASVVFDCVHAPFPEPDAYARAFDAMASIIRREKDTLAAVVVEPIVQGAAGMRIYAPEYLRELRELARANDVLLVVDEVFAGYGRTGRMWACEHAGIAPDILCIGKAFASMIPMAATLVTEAVFDAFRGGKANTLYYGHTFCGNPIGAALAREVLAIYRDENVVAEAARKGARIAQAFAALGELPGIARVRNVGMIGAADLDSSSSYFGERGWRVFEEAKKRGAYLRPLGDTVYVAPPLVIEDAELDRLLDILQASVRATME